MGIYLLKFTTCLSILYFFYKVCLENENMHTFKRVYLLVSLVAALIIPLVVFSEYAEIAPVTNIPLEEHNKPQSTSSPVSVNAASEHTILDVAPILWSVYFIGVLLFGIKFLKNLYQILGRIRNNPKQKWNRCIYVLLNDALTPHTFLSYIFLNRQKFEANEIPKEVLVHEQTHVRQKHSYDILIVEFLQVVFWINPFIFLIKKAIKLNHEFLADEAVLYKKFSTVAYQNTLLSFVSKDSENRHPSPLVNPINYSSYSSLKKRFNIMKKQTSKKAILLRSILVLPLFSLLLFGFSDTALVPVVKETNLESKQNSFSIDSPANNHLETILDGNEELTTRNITLAGLILDAETLQPLAKVAFRDTNGKILSVTDDRGFYSATFDVLGKGELRFDFSLDKPGYKTMYQKEHWGDLSGPIGTTFYFGLQKENSDTPEISELGKLTKQLSYQAVLKDYKPIQARIYFEQRVQLLRKKYTDIAMKIDGIPYLVSNTGWIKLQTKKDLVTINQKMIVPAFKLNTIINRNDITGMTPLEDTGEASYAIYTHEHLESRTIQETTTIKKLMLNIDKNGQLFLQNDKIAIEDLQKSLSKINPHLSKQERKQLVRAVVFAPIGTPQKLIDRIDAAFMEYGVATINIVGPEMEIKITEPLATPKQVAEYNKLAKRYNHMPRNKMKIYKRDVEQLEYLFSKMSEDQKSNAEPFPDFPEPPPAPKTPNSLSEKEEAAIIIQQIIEEQDPYDNVHAGLMLEPKDAGFTIPKNTHVYIHNSQTSPNTPSGLINNLASDDLKNAQFYFEGEKISSKEGLELIKNKKDIKVETIPYTTKQPEVRIYKAESEGTIPPPPNPPKALKGQLSDIPPPPSPVVLKGTTSSIPPPPLPSKPVSPLDHVIAMAKKDAQFLYEGKEISSDKAITLIKNNKDLNIDSRATKGKRPMVTISTDPIRN